MPRQRPGPAHLGDGSLGSLGTPRRRGRRDDAVGQLGGQPHVLRPFGGEVDRHVVRRRVPQLDGGPGHVDRLAGEQGLDDADAVAEIRCA